MLDEFDGESLPDGLPWLSVWTENDETVQPPDSARLDGAVNVALQSICPQARVSHGELPTDPAVTALVLRALGTEPLSAPTTPARSRSNSQGLARFLCVRRASLPCSAHTQESAGEPSDR